MSENWNNKLMSAAWDQNSKLEIIEEALNSGADVNFEDDRWTPLLVLIYNYITHKKGLNSVKLLISRGANVNRICSSWWENGNTVLAICVKQNLSECAKYLISVGANVCIVGNKAKTPLFWAVHNQNIEMIELLLDHGAQLTIPTAFLKAIELNNLEIVKILISKGANVNLLYKNGCTSLTKALEIGKNGPNNLELVKTLISKGADVNLKDKNGYTPLTKALEVVRSEIVLEIVEELIEKGADINTADVHGNLPLIKSIKSGRFELARLFMDKGANINTADTENNSPLTVSAKLGNLDLVKALFEKGATLKVNNKLGLSPFQIAVLEDHFEIVKYFVEQGEDVNQVFDNKETPLSIAASKFNYQLCQFLVDSGADTNLAKEKFEEIASRNEDFDLLVSTLQGKNENKKKTKLVGSNNEQEAAP